MPESKNINSVEIYQGGICIYFNGDMDPEYPAMHKQYRLPADQLQKILTQSNIDFTTKPGRSYPQLQVVEPIK